MQVHHRFYGEEANAIADHIFGKFKGGETDVNTKVHFIVKGVEGRTVVEVSFEV